MQTTRQTILAYLEVNQAASPRQLGRALQISAADVRYHLGALRREGLVEVFHQQSPEGPGRPTNLYRLTGPARPGNYPQLSEALLAAAAEDGNPALLRAAARHLAGNPQSIHKNLTQRLVEAVRRLNELHYQARWEAHAQAPRLRFGACPYLAILSDHPELCQFDVCLLEHLTGRSVQQFARLSPAEEGVHFCLFLIQNT